MFKFFEKKKPKKKSIEDDIFEMDAMDFEELSRPEITDERKKELRISREQNLRTLGNIEVAKIDRQKGITVAGISGGVTLAGIAATIIWYVTQYRRSSDPDDSAQMDLDRNPNSSSRAGSKLLDKIVKK